MKQVFFILLGMMLLPVLAPAQLPDTLVKHKDSLAVTAIADSLPKAAYTVKTGLAANSIINRTGAPVFLQVKEKKRVNKDVIFYMLAALVLLLALFRYFFARYFSNLFQVFFNTSLRQSQLADQLLQAKLPSLLCNLFFVVSGGFYVYSLLVYYRWIGYQQSWLAPAFCIGAVGLVYLIKYCTLRFTGWLTSYASIIDTYIFIIFLINKIIGIFLVPFIILMTFSDKSVVDIAVIVSLLLTGFMLVLRFLRSYGLIQNQLKVSRFHFLLYILGIEILPLLLIYKALVILLNKNL